MKNRQEKVQRMAQRGEQLQRDEVAHLEEQFSKFKERLEHFAKNHRHEIKKNPEFRRQFQSGLEIVGSHRLNWRIAIQHGVSHDIF